MVRRRHQLARGIASPMPFPPRVAATRPGAWPWTNSPRPGRSTPRPVHAVRVIRGEWARCRRRAPRAGGDLPQAADVLLSPRWPPGERAAEERRLNKGREYQSGTIGTPADTGVRVQVLGRRRDRGHAGCQAGSRDVPEHVGSDKRGSTPTASSRDRSTSFCVPSLDHRRTTAASHPLGRTGPARQSPDGTCPGRAPSPS